MKKEKKYNRVYFTPECIQEAAQTISEYADKEQRKFQQHRLKTSTGDVSWTYDNEEEIFADYREGVDYAVYRKSFPGLDLGLTWFDTQSTEVEIQASTRQQIETVFQVFEKYAPECKLPEPPKPEPQESPAPTIFIGHGRSEQWRDLKDHLHDQHGHEVVAYEVGARAGHTVRDVLEDMLTKSSLAILVMTGEDETGDGKLRARQNVVHEIGLFQGKLGFSKAIVLLEEGTEEFSNIQGIHQLRYSKNNIKETFGDVLATLRREFG